jgi:hypothetical protein
MRTPYYCGTPERRAAVRDADPARGERVLNGIDFLEVASDEQLTLEITFLAPLPGETDGVPAAPALTETSIVIEGGTRVTDVAVMGVSAAANVLTVTVDRAGDFSTYRLRLVAGPGAADPPDGFDTLLAEVAFSFKAACPSDFDCEQDVSCPPEPRAQPIIDYLAKDYASFRRLMLDRMRVTLPDWTERNPADLGITLVELLSYAGDHLSYYQDAIATEAYLGTARRRSSLRRHARLLDYAVDDGAAARAWVVIEATAAAVLEGPRTIEQGAPSDRPGTLFLTRATDLPVILAPDDVDNVLDHGGEPFELLHDLTVRAGWHELEFYTWGDEDCCLPRGATRASLRNPAGLLDQLAVGDVLVFEEVRGADSGRTEDADPDHRHAVRLKDVRLTEDPLLPDSPGADPNAPRLGVVEIAWDAADALPFPLCLRVVEDPGDPTQRVPVSVARGNVGLVEHGRTLPLEVEGSGTPRPREALPAATAARFRPRLAESGVAPRARVVRRDGSVGDLDPDSPAARALAMDARSAVPSVYLREVDTGLRWSAERDLLDGDAFERAFVAEPEEDGSVTLRFGDGINGAAPRPGARLAASYRLGGGARGNVGAGAITHVVSNDDALRRVRNPLPARGGADPETLDRIRMDAPQAFRRQERAVTEADYAEVAGRHPGVQRAAATFRWTGSWLTVFITVDRRGGLPVDAAFEDEMVAFLDRFSLAGYDLEIEPPRFVPLDLAFTVCVAAGFVRADVKQALLDVFSNRTRADGTRGFFHPDEFTFGQPLHLSRIVATAMAVPGVESIDTDDSSPKRNRFKRYGEPARGETAAARIQPARLEILRLDNDPSVPENGRIELFMEGGL